MEINHWLDEAEALLTSFTLHGTSEDMQDQLTKQKVIISVFKGLLEKAFGP